jgi:anhydro-N-acetylmuramic acid kinase
LLERCLKHSYFQRTPPKSTGREEFGVDFAARLAADARAAGVDGDDLIATATALTIESIAGSAMRSGIESLIVSGGGVHNRAIMAGLQRALPAVEVLSSAACGVDPDAKEALAFAVLAWAHERGVPTGLPSVTGAEHATVLGQRAP